MKKYLLVVPFVFLLCFVVGCQDKEAMAELEEFKTQAVVEEENKEIVLRYNEEIDNPGYYAGNSSLLHRL